MGDDADRAKLEGMTELEREEILADRRDARAKIQDRKRIIQMAREKKEREAGGKKKFKPSDAAAVAGRKSSRVAVGEEARGETKTSKALAEIARKKAKARSRRDAAADDDSDADSDDDAYDDEDLEDEDLDGILPTREKRRAVARGRGRGRGGYGSDASDDDSDDDGGDRVPASELQIRKIVLRRETLERWIVEPFVQDLAPGCFVRIGIGMDRTTGDLKYRLASVSAVAEGRHNNYELKEYEYVPRSGKTTNRWLILKFGSSERAFKITDVSNGEVSEKEYNDWREACAKDGAPAPRLRDVLAAEENIRAAENYRYTAEDINAMLAKRTASKAGMKHNLASQKEVLRRLIEKAKQEGDEEARKSLEEELETVMVKLAKRLDKGGSQSVMAKINKRNNQINDANLSRIASETVARAKSGAPDESANDPFSRRPTRMATYYNIKSGDGADQDQEKTQPGTATTPGAEGSLAAIKTKGGRKGRGPKTPKTPKTGSLRSHAVAAAAKLAALAAAHKRKALPGVTPALANAPDPAAKVGLSPGLVPMLRRGLLGLGSGLLAGVEPVRPRGKTLTLEEYKVRQGIE